LTWKEEERTKKKGSKNVTIKGRARRRVSGKLTDGDTNLVPKTTNQGKENRGEVSASQKTGAG